MKYENINHGDWFKKHDGRRVQIEDPGPVYSVDTGDNVVANVDLEPLRLAPDMLYLNGFEKRTTDGALHKRHELESTDEYYHVVVFFNGPKINLYAYNFRTKRRIDGDLQSVADFQIMLRAVGLVQLANKIKL